MLAGLGHRPCQGLGTAGFGQYDIDADRDREGEVRYEDGLLRPALTAEDLVLFSGSLSQAALTTGDSQPGQGRGLLRISLDRLSGRNTAPLRVSVTGSTALTAAALFARRCRVKEKGQTSCGRSGWAPFADDPAVGGVVEAHGPHRDLVVESVT
ncbi:hypothetical protein AB0L47_18020 [Streptomyces bobili]|uniref:hypothetical protein n=1 Tax=Streptomyces bobili TaxID=67280 RepID=UPI00342F63D7